MVTKAKKALLASLAAFLCVMLTVFGLSMSVSLSETAKAADETSAVAQVGTRTYGTLNGAIGAAADGNTVTLLKDTTEDVVVNKNITLDLGGNTLTGTNSGKATVSIQNGATTTVKNGSVIGTSSYYTIEITKGSNATATFEDLTATAGNTGSSMIDNWGTLTITSGTYTGGLNTVKSEEGTTLTITGGKFVSDYAPAYNVTGTILAYGTTTISGGEFIQNSTSTAARVVVTGLVEGYTSITNVTGGSFTTKSSGNIFHGLGKATSDNFKVSGGTFNKVISADYCAEGFIPSTTKNADGMYGVKEGKYVAKIGSKKYETLADAIRLATKGKTVTLLDNISGNFEIASAKNITLDLNGFTLNGGKGTAKAAITNYGTLTIIDSSEAKTGTIKRDDSGIVGETSYYVIRNLGTMTINQANVVNNSGYRKTNPSGSMIGSSLICNGDNDEGATLTIKGGKLTQLNFIAIKNGANGTLVVNGGEITSNHSAVQNWFNATITGGKITGQIWTDAYIAGESVGNTVLDGDVQFTGEIVMDVYGSIKPELTIKGGNLSVTNWKVTTACAKLGGKPAVQGGTFTNAVPAEYCADRFIPTQNTDGTYGVKACVAKVGSTKYETLAEAIAAAKDGDTVTLLDNIILTEQLVIDKNLTIDLGGFTLTSNYSLVGSGANIYAIVLNAAVTIKNGKIIANNARVIGAYAAMIMDGVTVENGIIGGHATIGLSGAGSEYVIRNSTINGAYSVSIFANNATVTITDCKLIGRGNTLYHNGSNYGLKLTVTGTEISSSASCGVYISGSTEAQSNTANQNGAGGYQQATFTRCTISGTNGIEVKYTNLTLNSCSVSTTENTPSYKQENNGPAASGFAVVSTDNAMGGTTPVPKGTIVVSGEGNYVGAIGIGTLIKNTYEGFEDASYAVSGGTFNHAILPEYCADGFIPTQNADGTYGVKEGTYVAEVKGVKYETLQAAIDAAPEKAIVTLLADTRENVTIAKRLTLDLNGYTVNGGKETRKPAVTVTARVTIKDSSAAQTGTIMREDTAENSGVSSHYVIDIQGAGWLTFESGNVINNSGNNAGKGASLVRVGDDSVAKQPGLNIKGGTFTQDNFIVIKVDRGFFYLNGGTLNSESSYAIENWHGATVKGGTVNGAVSSWTYSGGLNSDLTISGGTINGDVQSVSYDGAAGKLAKVSITGGTVTGTLSNKVYNKPGEADKAKATIEVSGGTFKNAVPAEYCAEGFIPQDNGDGTFGVEKTEKVYLAKIGETFYSTMEEAFEAQKTGEAIVLLRDYTTVSTFNSGSINREVDLNGHTWTYTGTRMNEAAFEINHSDVTLTVKNGTIISNTLVGLISSVSAKNGTITYDNAGLVFENVEMTSNGGSGIETNGNNTNDSVTLKDSTLNVPNGFGIYFPSSGTLTIDNSTITAKTMGVQVCSGKLNINAGSAITVTGDAVPKAENDGAIQDGAAISIVNRTGYKGLSNIVITGGTFTAKAGNDAIKAYDWNNAENKGSDFTKADLVAVSGGTFSSEVNKDYLADGFVVNKNNTNGTYGVTAGSGFAGANVVVTESLAMKVTIANGTASKYVVVTYKGLDGVDKSVKLDTLTDGYYLFDRIMPQMIDVKFSFELYGENDVMLDRKANYSVVDYLAHIIASDKDSVAFRNVAASLIEYANRAKVVKGLTKIAPEFVKGTEKVDLTELYKTFIADEKNKIPAKDTVKAEDISKGDAQVIYKAKVVFDDAYTLKFYTNDNEKQYTYKLDDKDIVFDENGEYTVNVLAQNITTKYVLTVYDKDLKLVQTVTYGVSTYCIRMQETKTPQGELYVASYYYGVAVNQYGTANPNSVQG